MKLLSIKPKTGYLNRRRRPRPRNRRLQRVPLDAKWIEDEHEHEYEATDELICIIKFLIRFDWTLAARGGADT